MVAIPLGPRFELPTSTDTACNLLVEHVRLTASGDDTFNNTLTELSAQGFNAPDRKYLVWMESTVLCGIATYYPDDRKTAGNLNTVNRCRAATLYYGPWPGQAPGTVWLAGHAHCGFSLWAKLGVGTRVSLTGPHGALEYVISDRVWVPRKGGSSVGLVHHDLMLQTCVGKGTSLTYATRIRPSAAGVLPG
jgi:hypothetical protein